MADRRKTDGKWYPIPEAAKKSVDEARWERYVAGVRQEASFGETLLSLDEAEARRHRAYLTKSGRLTAWEARVGRKGAFSAGSFDAADDFTPHPNSHSAQQLRREGKGIPTGRFQSKY